MLSAEGPAAIYQGEWAQGKGNPDFPELLHTDSELTLTPEGPQEPHWSTGQVISGILVQ